MTGTPLHNAWKGMMTRCYNSNRVEYVNYGGRGIFVCEDWHLFENFRDDMENTWFPGASLERTDNDLGYSPENCVWATRQEQNSNRRPSTEWSFKSSAKAGTKSGVKGVCWDGSRGKWLAIICVSRKYRNLGRFNSIEEAKMAYDSASQELRGL